MDVEIIDLQSLELTPIGEMDLPEDLQAFCKKNKGITHGCWIDTKKEKEREILIYKQSGC